MNQVQLTINSRQQQFFANDFKQKNNPSTLFRLPTSFPTRPNGREIKKQIPYIQCTSELKRAE